MYSRRRSFYSLLAGLVLVGMTVGLAFTARADLHWRRPITLSDLPGPSLSPQVALDPVMGDLFTIWTDEGLGEWTEVLGRRWQRTSGSWTTIENLSQSEWEDQSPQLFFDSRGWGLVLWTRRYAIAQGAPVNGTDLLWRAWSGTEWTEERVLMHRDYYLPGTYGLIPVETPDAILLFITYSNGYRVTEYRNGVWSELSPWEYLSFEDPVVNPILAEILWDDQGLLHAAAFGENSSQQGYDPYFRDAYYLVFDGVEWSKPLNLSATDGVASDVDLAFDGQGRLHFLWSDPDSVFSSESTKSAIWERVHEDGMWSGTNVEVTAYNADQAIAGFSLTADVTGGLHLAWSEGLMSGFSHNELDIYYQTGNGATWGLEEQVYPSLSNSRDPSLVVFGDGAALAWEEGNQLGGQILFSRRVAGGINWIYLPMISR